VKKTVTTRALHQRINRKLEKKDQKLFKSRTQQDVSDLGDYYLIDVSSNAIVGNHIDLESLGRELGALEEYEALGKK